MPNQHSALCNGGGEDACKVRQISVLFPRMDEGTARDVAAKGLKVSKLLTTVVFLKIDHNKQCSLEEKDQGIRMFFHASQSKKRRWWIKEISALSNGGEQFSVKSRDDKHAPAHLKLWEDEKYSCFKDDFEKFEKPGSTNFFCGNRAIEPEVRR
jgi:hypothetical protein